jgi:transposase-like protein
MGDTLIERSLFWCVRRYLSYKLSWRDLVEVVAERGLSLAPRRS